MVDLIHALSTLSWQGVIAFVALCAVAVMFIVALVLKL
jgi:hypothetical protein